MSRKIIKLEMPKCMVAPKNFSFSPFGGEGEKREKVKDRSAAPRREPGGPVTAGPRP